MTELGPRTAELLPTLSIEEKAALTAGSGFFRMAGVERLGLPNWLTTDGPNGARGTSLLGSGEAQATCVPCGSALGATWNPELVEEVGALLGRETRFKAARVLLAPTVNLHRSPLAGRNFECFSEDPLLSGVLAAAYIRGVQSEGVVTTVKHFVGNECETDRNTSNSIIDDRALRELYLVPFEYAVKEGGTLGVMTSYNRLNGRYCNEQKWLLTDVLRNEWGFEGFVVTDWFAGAFTESAAEAGLDIEMPAGDRIFGSVLAEAVRDGRVPESTLDRIAGRLLSVFERIGAFDDEPEIEQSIDLPEHRELARRAAADAIVLLRNESVDASSLLPLPVDQLTSIALIGPNAGRAQIMGGGSANLRPFHRTSPLDALRTRLGDSVTVTYAEGCNIDKVAPLLAGSEIRTPDGEQGFALDVFDNRNWEGEPIAQATRDTSRLTLTDEPAAGHKLTEFSVRARATYTPGVSGSFTFEVVQATPSRVFVDGELVIDGITERPPTGSAFFGMGSVPMTHSIELTAGSDHELVVETTTADESLLAGLDLRVRAPRPDDPLGEAVAVAAAADVAIVVVGTNDDWETEGEDRTFLGLPGRQDALVSAIVAANPRTVVVVNTGAPVTMPWAHSVPAILQSWLGGQEMADALVDVLTGAADPGGRLPTTLPVCLEHTPSYGHFPGDNGQVAYAESIFVGYRWYDSRRLPTLFPFGHGLSYAAFEVGEPAVVVDSASASGEVDITIEVPISNTSDRRGSHVVQCYVRPHQSQIVRPDKELKAFAKVTLDAGSSTTVVLTLDERSLAYWDPAQPEWPDLRAATAVTLPHLQGQERRTEPGWTVDPGRYDIVVANSATDPVASVTVDIAD
ncbi:MAG: glycoside hydrolase family 3 C-terminal domain-containing protein [Acidimicrobiia bacterium]|nr:glycoside hydrolase family 3 C-terminal domain-containing protein [Acidimicrobiia bacterium]MDH5520308.1 glycoside hydrolase family 3 C-terminal domain-containing protein [Acidimicrobiia bacterium]